MRSIVREFWILLVLIYVVLGFSIMRASERPLDRSVDLVSEIRIAEALPFMRAEMKKAPGPVKVPLSLSIVYLQRNEENRAVAALEKALALEK